MSNTSPVPNLKRGTRLQLWGPLSHSKRPGLAQGSLNESEPLRV